MTDPQAVFPLPFPPKPKRRNRLGRVAFLLALLSIPLAAQGQEARWKELKARCEALFKQAKYEQALPLAQEAVQVAEKTFGPEDARVADSLDDLGEIYHQMGQMDDSAKALQRALAIDEKALGKEHPDVASIEESLGTLYRDEGQFTDSDAAFQRALAIREKALGKEDPAVAETLEALGVQYSQQNRFAESEACFRRALAIYEKAIGPESAEVALTLHDWGFLELARARYRDAEPLFQRALAIRKKVLGEAHPDVGDTMSSLALTYADEGRWAEAEQLYLRALAIRENALGKDHPDVATTSVNLAQLYEAESRYAEAEPLLRRALAIYEKVIGPENLYVVVTASALADLLADQGRYGEAEALYLRTLAIQEKLIGKDAPDVAGTLRTLAIVDTDQGRYDEAEALLKRALDIGEKTLGKDNREVGVTVDQLAVLYAAQKRYAEAEVLMQRVLAIDEKAEGPEHPDIAVNLSNLGMLSDNLGREAEAESYLLRALALDEKVLGKNHPVTAGTLENLASVYSKLGRYAEAEAAFQRSLAIDERALGPDHPDVAKDLGGLAAMYYAQGRHQEASATYDRLLAGSAHRFQYYFTYMTEKQRLQFLDSVSSTFPAYFSFCLSYREKDPALAGKMYNVLLWEKGFVGQSIAAVRSRILASGDPQALALLDKLSIKKTQLATMLSGSAQQRRQHQAEIQQLEQETVALEKTLVQRSSALAEQKKLEQATWKEVRRALKPGEAAVEIARFRFFDGKKWTNKSYYVALVITPETRSQPALVVLGEGKDLEGAPLVEFQQRVQARGNGTAGAATIAPGPQAYRLFWKPLEAALAGKRRIYLAADGVLNQMPLGLIPTPGGKLLMEKYDLRLVSSTKDLLRGAGAPARRTAVLVGDPRFDLSEAQQRAALQTLAAPQKSEPVLMASLAATGRSRDQGDGLTLPPLPGTGAEIQAVDDLLQKHQWQATSYTGERALEEAVKQVRGPRLLHLATHGFFLPDQGADALEDPMLRSGLFFAGADRALAHASTPEDLDDGVLTAYEATGLNLQGTELVVLSACNTGQGEVKNGEGVFGLRRALEEAGAQAVMMSLWPVPDRETQELMTLFYRKWLAGTEKHEALRQAQLAERAVVKRRYGRDLPYYWGAFVLVGR